MEDYDYVNLESKESVAQQHAEIREALPTELRKSYDALVHAAENMAITNDKKLDSGLDPTDLQVKDLDVYLGYILIVDYLCQDEHVRHLCTNKGYWFCLGSDAVT